MKKGFREMLRERQVKTGSLLCVGLDPLPDKIPARVKNMDMNPWEDIFVHMRMIVDATADYACMFKPQRAHYEAVPEGERALRMLIEYIHEHHPGIPVFLDCKRGDIARTQECYREAHLILDGADGMNFSPYMGKDCMSALVSPETKGRALVGLCYTSNPDAREVQDLPLSGGGSLWEDIAMKTLEWAGQLGVTDNAGLVMAAAYKPKGSNDIFSWHLTLCRKIVGDKLWFLIPGVGTQGGFIEETVKAAFTGYGSMAVNSSSGITFASLGDDFAEAARAEAKKLRDQMHDVPHELKA